MNDPITDLPSPPPEPAPMPAARPPLPGWVTVSLGVLAVALLGVGGLALDTRGEIGELRQALAQRLTQGDEVAADARSLARQNQELILALQGKLGALEASVARSEGQTAALESLYQEFARSRDERVLAEVEQALTIASQQLQLAGNLDTALIALRSAHNRLASANQAALLPLRLAIARDIDALQAAPVVDVALLSARLEHLAGRIDSLPLAYAREADDTLPAAERPAAAPWPASLGETFENPGLILDLGARLAGEVWRELRQMVRIERLDQPAPVLLSPDQGSYLRENVKIRLLTARLALLSRDARSYGADLEAARDWLQRYFDADHGELQQVRKELDTLISTRIDVRPPTLTESLQALRLLEQPPADAVPAMAPAHAGGT